MIIVNFIVSVVIVVVIVIGIARYLSIFIGSVVIAFGISVLLSIEVEIVAIVTKKSMSVINTFWICYNHSYYLDNYIFQEITNFLRCHIPIPS